MKSEALSRSGSSNRTGILRRVPPWLTLLALAPILGELVSCHQTPLEFINPLNLLILSLPYGCGALVCRELMVRWRGSGLCLILLGVAYGVYEEGVVVYSLFDPQWSELGSLAQYGYYAGVNWTWAVMTVQFHAAISIGSSVALAHMIYTNRRAQPWLGKRGLAVCFAGLLTWIPVMGLIMILDMKRPFPPPHLYILACGIVLVLVYAARRFASRPASTVERAPAQPWFFFLLGLINITTVFVGVFLTAEQGTPPLVVTVMSLMLLDGVSLWLLWRWSGYGRGWDDRHRLALVAGLLAFFVYFSFDKDIELWQGSSIVGVMTILGLWRIGRTVHRRRIAQAK
ncbi:MAG: hypothetical protein NTW07_13475 [candidate division Zixibacteria bacterium]|nr:hypothetical protein [candidate division Zixibacteria bacterium]